MGSIGKGGSTGRATKKRTSTKAARKPARSRMSATDKASGVRLPRKLEHWPIGRVKPYEQNPRTHSEAQVAKIARSLEEFGWTNPILVDGKGRIVAGHGRLLAARELGMETVPVITLGDLTEDQRRAYVIADNRLALDAGWDEELLASELRELKVADFDLELTGFALDELEDLLELEEAGGEGGGEEQSGPSTTVTRPGDLWILGRHRLLCAKPGNDAFERLLEAADKSRSVCLAVTVDPQVCDGIIWGWQEATEKDAVLEGGGTFDVVAAQRGATRGE